MQLEFCDAYGTHCQLSLDSGRKIALDQLTQERTYSGLLEGFPDKRLNDWHVERAKKTAPDSVSVFLVPPIRRDHQRIPGDMVPFNEGRSTYRGPIEWLPHVFCCGVFKSFPPCDKQNDISVLAIVWFQDEFAMPIQQSILDDIQRISWEDHATDWVY